MMLLRLVLAAVTLSLAGLQFGLGFGFNAPVQDGRQVETRERGAERPAAPASELAAQESPGSGFVAEAWLEVVKGNPVADFGEVSAGSRVAHELTVRNRSREPVKLEFGAKSCGCLQSKIQPDTLAPGATADILLEVVAQPARDPQRQMARVIATAESGPEKGLVQIYTIELSFFVRIAYEVQPPVVVIHVPEGAAWEAPIYLVPHGPADATVPVGVKVLEARSVEPSWSTLILADGPRPGVAEVRVRGVADRPRRQYVVLSTNSAVLPEVSVLVVVRPVPRLFAVPAGALIEQSAKSGTESGTKSGTSSGGSSEHSFAISVRTDVSGPRSPEQWSVSFDGLEGLGISTKVSWLPRTGPVASPPLGELGRIEGVITTSDATPAAAVFDVVLTDVDGTELIRLPIALWTDGTE